MPAFVNACMSPHISTQWNALGEEQCARNFFFLSFESLLIKDAESESYSCIWDCGKERGGQARLDVYINCVV